MIARFSLFVFQIYQFDRIMQMFFDKSADFVLFLR
jgi:hypothetical protein